MRIAVAALMSLVALAGVSWSQDVAALTPTSKPAAVAPSTSPTQLPEEKRGALGVALDDGAVIKAVMPGSGAAKAGLQVSDAIVRIDDQPIKQTPDLVEIVRTKFAGDKVRVTFVRDGKEQAVDVTLGQSQPALPPGFEAMAKASYKPVKGALRAVAFLDDKVGYAAGDEGLCQTTADGGETWKKIDTGSKATYRAILIIDKNTLHLCGDSDPDASAVKAGHVVMLGRPMTNSTVTNTRDGGKTWTVVEAATNFILTSLARLDDARLLVGTFGGDLHRDGDVGVFDTSKSWSDGTKTFKGGALKTNRVFRALSAMCRIDEKNFAAVGSPVSVGFMPTPDHALYKARAARAIFSSDGGETWKPATGSDGSDMLRALAWQKGLPMVAVGDNGAILSSQDNGVAWTKASSPTKVALTGVAWSGGDAPVALAVGEKGVIAGSFDSGKTWLAATVDDSLTFTAVAAVGDGFAAATVQGKVMRMSRADLQRYFKTPTTGQSDGHASAPLAPASGLAITK